MISVIIPVYNTEKYLDKCIQSILRQTYKDLEIIFVNDGSTDYSLQILEKYQAEDDRIQIVSVENGGQGRARNIGIGRASGEFIMFVDSDDWISEECVETLYHTVEREQCDIAMGGIAKTYFEGEKILSVINPQIPFVIFNENKRQFLFRISSYPFAQLIRRELFVKHDIFFPLHYFEDVATLPLLYAVADKICYQSDIIYYYRNWGGSTVHNIKLVGDRLTCVSTLERGLKQLGLYEEYKDEFLGFASQRSRINQRVVRELFDKQYQEYERRQFIFDYQTLGRIEDIGRKKTCVYGSYNLMIASKIFLGLKNEENVPNYYGFQNIISSMSPRIRSAADMISGIPVGNPFRKTALVQDFEKGLVRQEWKRSDGIDYFILDFLEERYDTGQIGDGCFTLSNAFLEVKSWLGMEYGILQSFCAEWNQVWQEKCDSFIRFIREAVGDGKIILVKMKLSEKNVLNGEAETFSDIQSIQRINSQLEGCYDYFIKNCQEAVVVDVEYMDSYFTDQEFRHGCFPWHLNDAAYGEIAREIKRAVDYRKYQELLAQESAVEANGI